MKSVNSHGQARAPSDAGAGSVRAAADESAPVAGTADLLTVWRAGRDANGNYPAAQFDLTELSTDLLPDLFVVRALDNRFEPVMAGARVGDPFARLAETAGEATGCGLLERCRAGNAPVDLPPRKQDAQPAGGLLVPLVDAGRVSHIAGVLPSGADAPETGDPFEGFPTANLPMVDSQAHADILAYWGSKRAGRALPARGDIDPLEIPRLLRHLMLIDVLGPPRDFRYRLLGDDILMRARPGLKGRCFSEIEGKARGSSVWETANKVVETGVPRFGRAGYSGPDRFTTAVSDLLMPLSDDGETVSQLLILVLFHNRDLGGTAARSA